MIDMKHRTLQAFEESLSNIVSACADGQCNLEDVLDAADRVECYRANVGINTKRLPYNEREKAFYEQWQQENAPVPGVNNGRGILQDLFIERYLTHLGGSKVHEEISNRDRRIVATVIQWLGSNVGMCFLNEALSRFGAKITYETKHQNP